MSQYLCECERGSSLDRWLDRQGQTSCFGCKYASLQRHHVLITALMRKFGGGIRRRLGTEQLKMKKLVVASKLGFGGAILVIRTHESGKLDNVSHSIRYTIFDLH
jgi:hypothetical protein